MAEAAAQRLQAAWGGRSGRSKTFDAGDIKVLNLAGDEILTQKFQDQTVFALKKSVADAMGSGPRQSSESVALRIRRQDVHLAAGTRKLENHEMLKNLDSQARNQLT